MAYSTFQPIVTDGLVFNMDPFNTKSYNGVSNIVTDIVTGSTGSLINGVTYSGGSFYFDGSNDFISLNTINFNTDYTINTWIKTPSTFSGYKMIFSSSQFYVYLSLYNNQFTYDTLSNNTFRFGQTLSPNTWYNVSIVKSSNILYTYINGTYITSNPDTTNITNGSSFNIGRWAYNSTLYYDGNISIFSIYNRALSATEILQNYNATKWRFVSNSRYVDNGLVFYIDVTMSSSYPGTGTTVYNLKGPETATLTNGPTFDGSSLYFDGVNDYASISSLTPYTGLQPHSYACWIKFVNGSGYNWILNNGDSSTGTSLIIYGSKVGFFYGGGQAVVGGTTTLSPNTWYYITTTYDGSTGVKFYVNGVLDGTKSTTSPDAGNSLSNWANTGNNSPRINGWNNGAYLINCNINHLMVYNRKLESSEVLQNYNATKSRFI